MTTSLLLFVEVAISAPAGLLGKFFFCDTAKRQKERGSNLRWSPSTVWALPGMCPNRSCGRGLGGDRDREETLHVVGALGVLGDVEAFTLALDIGAEANDHVDDLVEDRRTDARPDQR